MSVGSNTNHTANEPATVMMMWRGHRSVVVATVVVRRYTIVVFTSGHQCGGVRSNERGDGDASSHFTLCSK